MLQAYEIQFRATIVGDVYELIDRKHESAATVVPAVGAQCSKFTRSFDGRAIDLLVAPESLAALKERPIYYGNPILFPFPNRIKGGVFEFGNRRVELPVTEPLGNAIHGLTINRPWQVLAHGASDEEGAWITCVFDTAHHADLLDVYPFPFRIEYTYRLRNGRLESFVRASNPGKEPMPMGFGLHPWFPMPLTRDGSRAACRLKAPVSRIWELDRLVPTGNIVDADPNRALERGPRIGDETFDDVYTGLNAGLSEGAFSESVYTDPGSGVEIAVLADASFRELVVYAPDDKPVVCLEPYTCTTDAFNLSGRGVDAGTIVLEPGEEWTGVVIYEPRAARAS